MRLRLPLTFSTATIVAWALGVAACSDARLQPAESVGSTKSALAGVEGMFEYAIDAPWRMEPRGTAGAKTYGPLPIQISIHDALHVGDDTKANVDLSDSSPATIGRVCRLDVRDRHGLVDAVTSIPVRDFDEIERTVGEWPYPAGSQTNDPARASCTKTGSTTCEGLASLAGTSEWHGLVLYNAPAMEPGAEAALDFQLVVTRGDGACPDPVAYPAFADLPAAVAAGSYRLRNHARVHYGEDTLPRIGKSIYGDLHYHSQGTDNEGESGYNYGGVSRAMQAIGLDFLWATEHASSAEQLTDIDASLVNWDSWAGKVPGVINAPHNLAVKARRGALRDMDARRFAAMSQLVQQVNAAAAGRATATARAPQIFLGGEVDVIPETNRPVTENIKYGADKSYDMAGLCGGLEGKVKGRVSTSACAGEVFACYDLTLLDEATCSPANLAVPTTDGSGVNLIEDLQGLNEQFFGREHMVYLPSPTPVAGEETLFVASNTSTYGGASRPLVDHRISVASGSTDGGGGTSPLTRRITRTERTLPGVLPEVERKAGKLFIAHHLNAPSPGSSGPNGPPWSESMLEQAWRSPAVLGLEFWNEDPRLRLAVPAGSTKGYERDDDVYSGSVLGYPLSKDLKLTNQKRAGLRATSDGVFDLLLPDLGSAPWSRASSEVDEVLTDGAVSWDRLNLRGIDAWDAQSVPWLPKDPASNIPVLPRRLFMAGGSDAHGDFNYRREGYATGTSEIVDTAIGKPRNLVFAGDPTTTLGAGLPPVYGPKQVRDALEAGRFSVTDGPAVRVVVDTNKDGTIDASDAQMGDSIVITNRTTLPVVVEWASTAEFGPVERIELTVGVSDPGSHQNRLYTGGSGTVPTTKPNTGSYSKNGVSYAQDERGYWHVGGVQSAGGEVTGMLSAAFPLATSTPGAYMTGKRTFNLDLSKLDLPQGSTPTRLFVRAIAITPPRDTHIDNTCGVVEDSTKSIPCDDCSNPKSLSARSGLCIRRYGFSNPIWALGAPPIRPYRRQPLVDFNHDGFVDFADHDLSSGNFTIRENLKNGTFAATSSGSGTTPSSSDYEVLLGDFNGDGYADWAAHQFSTGSIFTHVNFKNGTFSWLTSASPVRTRTGPDYETLVGDFNADGYADFADHQLSTGKFWIRTNLKNGSFAAVGSEWGTGTTAVGADYETLIGDFNNDGYADFADHQLSTGKLWVHASLKNGTFAGVGNYWATATTAYGRDFETLVGDFDGDGYADYADHQISTGKISIHANLKNGTFAGVGIASGAATTAIGTSVGVLGYVRP